MNFSRDGLVRGLPIGGRSELPTIGRSMVAAAALLVALCAAGGRAADDRLSFNADIRPILSDKCFACHGFDAQNRQAELRLDTAEGAYEDRGGSRAIVPGDLAASELWRRITSDDPDERMPPADSPKPLSPTEIDVLRRWIEQGAEYQKHWAFEPLERHALPTVSPSAEHPIDRWISSRLQAAGLQLAAEADRPTLLRRVAFALTGLPPTIAQAEAYFADQAPGAYERMVDRFLESQHYGEEMARHWLDVARYADTHGMHLDNERQTWAYRDWVVRAFNQNLPFDRFTIDQLAGDLLAEPTADQLTATGFNRCNVTSSEGGSIDDELLFRYAVDRTSTMMQAWMGLTGGCAVCHDHKFDPISQREFYSMYAFFNSAADPAMDGNALLTQPVLKLETPESRQELAALDAQIATQQQLLDQTIRQLEYVDPATAAVPELTGTPSSAGDPARSFLAWWKAAEGKDIAELPDDLKAIAKLGPAGGADADAQRRLQLHYLQNICVDTQPRFAPLLAELARLRTSRSAIENAIPSTFVFRDRPEPRPSFVMIRGAYDKPGEPVTAGVPAVLPPLHPSDAERPATRLDLARWLVSGEHPLTARVTVNRFWQQFFGTGLVKTSYDFGTQGELPSHPELLDWLAVRFQESGWDVKQLVRLLLTSATFRQSAAVSADLYVRDPENRLYARGPRFRLDAEQIRDNALFVSGLLQLEMGGKGVKPYQPVNIWEPVGFAGSNTRFYEQDHGTALYRRSLYTFLKRTAPPPFMANFDAPNREQFCTRRERSNTPLQALQLMNDVQHVEAARALAERMLVEGGRDTADRLTFAYRTVLARRPESAELALVQQQLETHLARYREDAEAAQALISAGESKARPELPAAELAAYTLVANMLLNLDETLTRN
jgi:hypothetical protein